MTDTLTESFSTAAPRPVRSTRRRRNLVELSMADVFDMARDGDSDAFTELTNRLRPIINGRARQCGLDASSAEDLAQETWMHLHLNMARIRQPDALPGWIRVTAERLAWTMKRRRTVDLDRFAADAYVGPASTPEEAVIQAAESQEVRRAYEALAPRDRAVIELTVLSDPAPPYTEIASTLGCAIGSIGAFRMRSLDRLDRSLGGAGRRVGRPLPSGRRRPSVSH